MKLPALIAFASSLLIAAASAREQGGDEEQIQGTWELVSALENGKDNPDFKKGTRMTYRAKGVFTVKAGGETADGTYKLDPSKSPKWIDSSIGEGRDKDTFVGIYELKGDTLRICHNARGKKERPERFASEPNSPHLVLLVLKRVKG